MPTMRTLVRGFLGLIVPYLFAVACDRNREPNPPSAPNDSLGVQVGESPSGGGTPPGAPSGMEVDPDVTTWSVSPDPVLTIGELEGPEEYLLFRARSGLVLDGGKILLSNSGTGELRLYSEDGSFLGSSGGRGQGPGEFGPSALMRVFRRGPDSMVVTDDMGGRESVFSLDGGFGHAFSLASVEGHGWPFLVGVFEDKRVLAQMAVGTGRSEGAVGERTDMRFSFFAYDAGGLHPRKLAEADDRPRIVNSLGGGAVHYPYVPLTPGPVFSVYGNDFLLSSGGDPEVRRITPAGEVRSVFRWDQSRTAVKDIWGRFSEEFLEEVDEARRPAYARLLAMDGLPIPELVPAVSEIQVDPFGFIWVQEYRLPWELEPAWNILDQDGHWMGALRTPPGVSILQIGEDFILGRHLDDLGVERVVLYSLTRGVRPSEP